MKKIKLFVLLGLIVSLTLFAQEKSPLKWLIGYHKSIVDQPAKWLNSTVPGAIQLDVMYGENYKQPYWYGNNFEQFTWMESYHFTYKSNFAKPTVKAGQKVYFHSKGIDYQFSISLNGEKLLDQEGMFAYVNIDITDKLKDQNELKITLLPVPTVTGSRNTIWHYRDNARNSAKPAVSYGWDWHPRLITRGIWDETYLEVKNESFLKSATVDYDLNDALTDAKVRVNIEGDGLKSAGIGYKWMLKGADGSVVLTKEGKLTSDQEIISSDIKNVKLWWPNGYGKQELYTSTFELSKNGALLEKKEAKVGFRRIKMIMSDGGWLEPQMFPKSRSVAPANFEVNGKRIFAKGSNWVHPEIFPGIMTKATYEPQIKLAKDANFNIFRVWGGGITNKESFFDLCDEYGILVWQEFPLACNLYPDDAGYLIILRVTIVLSFHSNH